MRTKEDTQHTRNLKTLRQFASETGLSIHTARKWVAQRRIKFIKLGACVRIPDEEIDRLVRQGEVPPLPTRR